MSSYGRSSRDISSYVTSGRQPDRDAPRQPLGRPAWHIRHGPTLIESISSIDNSTTAGIGLVKETIQFHGTADLYILTLHRSWLVYSRRNDADLIPGCDLEKRGFWTGKLRRLLSTWRDPLFIRDKETRPGRSSFAIRTLAAS